MNAKHPDDPRAHWPADAHVRVPFFIHRSLRRVEDVLAQCSLRKEPVVVAVSGGGDSMALLELVSMLAPKLALDLHVAFVDHGLRPETGQEQELVRQASLARGATLHCVRIEPGSGDEDTLRTARHAALRQIASETGARAILLGHTSDDQIETIVFRFLRGAAFGGLAGMREVRLPLVRPLLSMRREELRRVLRARGVRWAEDTTNVSGRYARGRLRTLVLPVLERAFGRGALDHLLDVAPRWRADEEFLEAEAGALLAQASQRTDPGLELETGILAGAHRALRARALRRWMLEQTGRVPASRELAAIERWLDEPRGTSAIDVAGARLLKRRGRLWLGDAIAPDASPGEPARVDRPTSRDLSPSPVARCANAEDSGQDALLPPSEGRVRFPRT